ncbi:hypothetical protein [Pelagerythrobacter aerophilus]
MKRAIALVVSSVALVGSQAAMANHPYVVPPATTPWVFQGEVHVEKGIELDCNATVTISGPNDAADTSPAFNHSDVENLSATITLTGGTLGLCSSVNVASIPAGDISYVSTGNSSGVFTLHDVFVTTITPGNCEGDITAVWTEAGVDTLAVSGVLPAVSGSDCQMEGTVDLTSPSSGNTSAPGDSDHNSNHGNNA